MQEVGGLLERVGAVRDDHAGHLGARQMVRAAPGQALPGGEVHVLAVELRHLLALDVHAGQRRNRRHQLGHAKLRGGVAHAVGGARGSAGDGAAGAQDHDFACHERQSG